MKQIRLLVLFLSTVSCVLQAQWREPVNSNIIKKLCLLVAFGIISFLTTFSQSTILDPTFGTGGKVITPIGNGLDWGRAIAIQSDGKIIVAGSTNVSSNGVDYNWDFVVVRYNTDGTLDNAFGNNGKVVTNVGTTGDLANAVAIQTDGKIVVGGVHYNDFAIVRYNTDGTLDNAFGTGGIVHHDMSGTEDVINDIAIQSDGKILAAGSSRNNINGYFSLARYNANGSLDNTFGNAGKILTIVGAGNWNPAYGIALQTTGKIILAGSSNNGSNDDFTIVRYNSDGTLDDTFDGDGIVKTDFGNYSYATDVVLQPDGKIVVVGNTIGANVDFAMVRYNSDGSLDNTFNGNGKIVTAIGGSIDYGQSIALQNDGKILVGGDSYNQNFHFDFAIARYNNNGVLDNTFGTAGKFIVDIRIEDRASAICVVGSRIYLAGYSDDDFAVAAINTFYYRDADGDGYGDATQSISAITQPSGYVANSSDCNDTDAAVNPATMWYLDADNDNYYTGSGIIGCTSPGSGYKYSEVEAGDCNDGNAAINPGVAEVCDGIDNNCNEEIDEGMITTFYRDGDGDGYGDAANSIQACAAPEGYVTDNTDCNDNDASIHPGAPTIICKTNQTRSANAGECTYTAMNNEFNVTANDNCSSVITYSYTLTGSTTGTGSDVNGQIFNAGTTTVSWTAMDGSGNTSNPCSFTVTVEDNQPPTIICAAPVTINTTAGLCTGTTTLSPPTVTDNCNSFGNALSFDGGYIDVPDAPLLTPFDGWTLETWVKRTTSDVQEGLIEKYTPAHGTYGYLLRIDGNKAFAGLVFTNSGGHFISGNTTILPNTWYHLATTFNRTTGEIKLYVNGVLDGQITGITGLPETPNAGSLKIGARGDDAIFRLSNGGILDEMRIWNVERTQLQIQSGMNSELSAQPGLVALYHLNEGIAGGTNTGLTTATDVSGNSNNGTLVNFALTGATSNWVSGQGFSPTITNDAPATYPIGNTIVTWTATDASGNSATCSQTVTVTENQPPSITCPATVTINTTPGLCTGTTVLSPPTVTDNCSSIGNGLSFDGGYVDVPHNALLSPFGAWTIETWVKRTNSHMQESLIEKYSNDGYGYLLRIEGNYAVASFLESSNFGHTITGTTPILPGVWHHLAATFNRASGELKLYVNGVLDAQLTGLSDLPTSPATQSLKLGARGDDAATRLSNGGLMDEIRIWNVERTQAEIQTGMNSELGVQPGLVALYHLNEGVAGGTNTGLTTATDVSGNSNNGTLISFALTGTTSNWVLGQFFGLTLTNDAPTTFPIGNTNVTWTATDESGNTATCTQLVTVVDNQQPVIASPVNGNTNRNTNAGVCTYQAGITEFDATATDNCGVTSLTYQLAGATTGTGTTLAGMVFNKGITTVTWTASDGVTSNVTSGFTVTVVDNEKPVITSCPTVPIRCYSATGTYPVTSLTATDNCGVQSISYVITGVTSRSGNTNNASGAFNPGTSTIEWTVTDLSGNTATCSTTVVIDKVDATIPNVYAANITSSIGMANTIYVGYGGSSVTLSASVTSSVNPNSYTYKWTIGSPAGPGFASTPNITVSPTTTTPYYLSIKDVNNCAPLYQVSKQINVINISCGTGKIWVCEPQKNGTYSSRCVSSADKTIRTLKAGWYLGQCPATIAATKGVTITSEQSNSLGEMTITASPNPATHSFSIIVHSSNKTEKITARVVDVLGRVIENRNSISEGQTFRLGENYSAGIYLVEAIQGNKRKTIKLIKQ